MVGAQIIHLLLENGYPQIFAEEFQDVQLILERRRLLCQPAAEGTLQWESQSLAIVSECVLWYQTRQQPWE